MSNLLATIDINPQGGEPQGSVIWLHGLGADGQDFVPIVSHLSFLDRVPLRFVFPHAPKRPITVNGSVEMRGWYDIRQADLSQDEDSEGMLQAESLIHSLIEREYALGIPYHRIALAGFSQGGAVALFTALRYPESLACVVALSTYLPMPSTFQKSGQTFHVCPILMTHGIFDPIVPMMLAQMSHEQLVQIGYHVDWQTYSMGHTVIPEEIAKIDEYLAKIYLP